MRKETENNYQDQKVAIVGGAGFVGRHLAKALLMAGADVSIFDNFEREGLVPFSKDDLPHSERLWITNLDVVLDKNLLAGMLKGGEYSHVFNLAAHVGGVEYNQLNQYEMYTKNILINASVIDSVREALIPNFLQVSSVCVYGEGYTSPCTVGNLGGDPTLANKGYSLAKRQAEVMTGLAGIKKAVIVRPTNIYGRFDYFDTRSHVIPALIKKVLAPGDTIQMFGDGTQRREFLHVLDASWGMMFALAFGKSGSVLNLGSDHRCNINSLLGLIQKICATNKQVIHNEDVNPGDKDRFLNNLPIKQLGWQASIDIETGLRDTIAWYKGLNNG